MLSRSSWHWNDTHPFVRCAKQRRRFYCRNEDRFFTARCYARLVDNGVQYIDSCCTLLHSGGSSHINGVALLLDKRLSGSLVSWSLISDRLLCARLVHKHGHLSVIVVYAPTQPSSASVSSDLKALYKSVIIIIIIRRHWQGHLLPITGLPNISNTSAWHCYHSRRFQCSDWIWPPWLWVCHW